MMHINLSTIALAVLGYLPALSAAPAPDVKHYAVKERHAIPRGWSAVSRAEGSHPITLQIGLKQQNLDKLEQHTIHVSDPSHARYGQYLSAEAVHELIAPSDVAIDLVKAWLGDHDITPSALSTTKD